MYFVLFIFGELLIWRFGTLERNRQNKFGY